MRRSCTNLLFVSCMAMVMAIGGAPAFSESPAPDLAPLGLEVDVTVSPAVARAGAPVKVRVRVRDTNQSQNALRVDFGDTTSPEFRR
jgi:hypothetical protein